MHSNRRWHQWIPKIAFIGALFILGGLALNGPAGERMEAMGPTCEVIARLLWTYGLNILPLVLIAASLFAQRRRLWVAGACVLMSVLIVVQMVMVVSGGEAILLKAISRGLVWTLYLAVLSWIPYIATVAALVCVPRLRGRGWLIQAITVASLASFEILHAMLPRTIQNSTDGLWAFACVACGIVSIMGVFWTGWATLFRQIKTGRTPSDSGREITLMCPRCATSQKIGIGEGECDNCRLQIYISVEEGACHLCGYRLRGLAGDKCPECGTSILVGAEV